jgi:hypothetical protein
MREANEGRRGINARDSHVAAPALCREAPVYFPAARLLVIGWRKSASVDPERSKNFALHNG